VAYFQGKNFISANKIFNLKNNVDIYRDDFDGCAKEYDHVPTRKLLGKFTEDLLRELTFKSGMYCIDLGCWTGHATEIIARNINSTGLVVGYDVSESMLKIAREKLGNSTNIKFINKDMLVALQKQKDNSVDLITAFWSIGYSNPNQVLKEIKRVLIPDGQVAILVNTQESLLELQKLVFKIVIWHPFVLKNIPPINFPVNIKTFHLI